MEMEKVLIMGGSYFIGKHVVNQLKQSFEVYVLNRGNQPFHDDSIHELVCDRNDTDKLIKVLSPYAFQYVVDISGYNKTQSMHLVQALKLTSLKKFVYISTSAAYNMSVLTPPFKEEDLLGGPSLFKDYAKNKIESEQYLINHLREDQLIIFRPPIVYGEDNYILRERLMFYLIENQMNIYVPSSNNLLSFVYVKDLALNVDQGLKGIIPSGIYNVGHREPLSFSAWAHLCAKVMHKEASIVFVDAKNPLLDIKHYFPFYAQDIVVSVDKIKTYAPYETAIEDGLKKAYQDYLNLKEGVTLPKEMLSMRNLIEELKQ
jgi:nucleoside-diphosphate-sugar epimerase